MANAITSSPYTVVKGDSLWSIAERWFGSAYGYRWTEIADLNNISRSNPLIIPGQKLNLPSKSGGSTYKKNTTNSAIILYFGPQAGTERKTLFATWSWDKVDTDKYKVKWDYSTGDGIWFVGEESDTKYKQSLYNVPSNAIKVRFRVKPISFTHPWNNTIREYNWIAEWSNDAIYTVVPVPATPSAPSVKIEGNILTAELDNIDTTNAKKIEFDIVKDNKYTFISKTEDIVGSYSRCTCEVGIGSVYKVRCRAISGSDKSDWSSYSNNYGTIPAAISSNFTLAAKSETEVQLEWAPVFNSKNYEIQYTDTKRYFDSSNNVKSVTVDALVASNAQITGLETGKRYFFRIRATNDNGNSPWTDIKSIIVGKVPTAPTTWSSTTTVTTGETLKLYWVHNSEDGSKETYAQVELNIDGVIRIETIKKSDAESEKDKAGCYEINTSTYSEGTNIKWRVRTKGILDAYSDWSTQRIVNVYALPNLSMNVTDINNNPIEIVTKFPFYISGEAGPNSQKPIGYHISITSTSTYETVDNLGNFKIVNKGDEVYYKNFDTSEDLFVEISASNISLSNNITYKVTCTVSMNSGLTATATSKFTVHWSNERYDPNAKIMIDDSNLVANIMPYCLDENDQLINGVSLSVYRREYDGTFTEIATNIDNNGRTFVTDPHPSLDLARYRIVSKINATGDITYYDVPGVFMGVNSVVIQWDEKWTSFDVYEDGISDQSNWGGSMLKLPYNIDVSDSNTSDSSLIEYIGRENPVSYYGTQLGITSTWKVEIEKDDKETLYAIRRLAIWMGDVYVREPSGSGYWANISVSYNQNHCNQTIPITFSIKRVEGGI